MTQKNYSPYFANNLNLLINHLNLTKQEFAKEAEITPTILSLFLHGKSQPNRATLMRLVERFHVSLDWLLFNKGTMFGTLSLDLMWYQAIMARLLLAQMKQIGIKEAFELEQEILKNNVDKSQWSPALLSLDNQIWQMCAINEQIVPIYNHIMSLGTEAERMDYLNQMILHREVPNHADSWQTAQQQHQQEQSLQQRLYWTHQAKS